MLVESKIIVAIPLSLGESSEFQPVSWSNIEEPISAVRLVFNPVCSRSKYHETAPVSTLTMTWAIEIPHDAP